MVRLTARRRFLIALLSGAGLSLAFLLLQDSLSAGLTWVSLALLVSVLVGARPWAGALYGFSCGTVYYALTLPWIYEVMRVHGGLSVGAAGAVMALVVAACSLFFAAFGMGTAWMSGCSVARACLTAPFLWVALEFARTRLPHIGFPWNLLGYATGNSLLLLQAAAATGIYGLSLFIAACCSFVAWVTHKARSRTSLGVCWILGLALVPVTTLANRWIPSEHPSHAARLVQTNFPQSPAYPADWMERHAGDLDELERLSVPAGEKPPGLVIWSEVPAPFSLEDPRFAARAQQIARASQGDFLVGVVDWRPTARGGLAPYNSAALLDASGREVFLYDKIHLVPFGEYVPLRQWLTFAGKLTAEVGDFQHGSEYKVGKLADGHGFGVFICYEAVFPDLVRRFTANGAELLVNLSNDGWFGRSAAPGQHLAMARVRAVESRRWLLRVTNNGYTVVVDPYGRYTARMAPDTRAAMTATYGVRSDLTPYARWGDWVAWLCVVVTLAMVVGRAARADSGVES